MGVHRYWSAFPREDLMQFFIYGFSKRAQEVLSGGKADGHKDSEYPQDQLKKGRKVEMEHTNDPRKANEVVKDHLQEEKESTGRSKEELRYYDDLLNKVEGSWKKAAFEVGFSKGARELTSKTRDKLPDESFVFPGERRYPIHDVAHARNALARVSQFGTASEKDAVRRAVHAKYPGVGHE